MIKQSELPANYEAELPANYETAKLAINECKKLDQCKDWADRAQAMASYAKQSKDNAMLNAALAIQARATKRCGELIKEIEAKHTGRIRADADPNSDTRKQAATDAGLSSRQAKTAVRLANIPDDEFDRQVDSDNPPTITELAEQGKKTRIKPNFPEQIGCTVEEFQAAGSVKGSLEYYMQGIQDYDPQSAANGLAEAEREGVLINLLAVEKFNKQLKGYLCKLQRKT